MTLDQYYTGPWASVQSKEDNGGWFQYWSIRYRRLLGPGNSLQERCGTATIARHYGRAAQGSSVLCALTGDVVLDAKNEPPSIRIKKGAVHSTTCAAPTLFKNVVRPSAARGLSMMDNKQKTMAQKGQHTKKPGHKLEPDSPEEQHPAHHSEASSNAAPP